MECEFRERKCLVQTDPSRRGGSVPKCPGGLDTGLEAGWSPCGSWIDGALGRGFSGTQLWGLQRCCDSGGALLRQQEAFMWCKGTQHSIPGLLEVMGQEGIMLGQHFGQICQSSSE